MVEALYATGGSYEAAEDRKLIKALFQAAGTGGVISGMTVTPGTGLNVTVAPGFFVVNDSTGGAYLGYITASETVSISGNTSGSSRTDTVYVQVNTTTGALTFSKVTGGTGIPAGSTRLASVVVPNNAASILLANITNNPGEVDLGGAANAKYLRKDQAQALFAGTTASTPTASGSALQVATRGYVDALTNRSNHYEWQWGGGANYDWRMSSNAMGNWNMAPGSAGQVPCIGGHMYQVNSDFAINAIYPSNAYNVRMSVHVQTHTPIAVNNGPQHVIAHRHAVVSHPQEHHWSRIPVNQIVNWRCPTSGNWWFSVHFATDSAPGKFHVHESYGYQPMTQVVDLGPMGLAGPLARA